MSLLISLGALSLLSVPITALPQGAVFNPSGPTFMQQTCDIVGDIGKKSSERWSQAKAEEVLSYANHNWNSNQDARGDVGLDYINTMFRLFNKPTANCAIASGSCDFSSESCQDKNDVKKGDPATVGMTPGAWAIRQSISHIHSYYLSLYNAVGGGSSDFAAQMAPFLDDFSPAKKQDLADKLIKSLNSFILDKAFELALGAGVGKFLANAGETLQEAVKEATTNLKDFAVDKLSKEEPTQEDKEKGLAAVLSATTVRFKGAVNNYVEHIFSGKVGGPITLLRKELSNGKWLEDHVKGAGNAAGLEGVMKTGFAATLVGEAWKITENLYPVILMLNENCNSGEPSVLMPKDVTHRGGSCAVEGKTFFLVGLNTGYCYHNPSSGTNKRDEIPAQNATDLLTRRQTGTGPGCDDTFKTLPGFDKLGAWGLEKDAIIRSAWETYKANGEKNGGAGNGDYINQGINAQGLYNIPICEMRAAEKKIVQNEGGTHPICDYGGW